MESTELHDNISVFFLFVKKELMILDDVVMAEAFHHMVKAFNFSAILKTHIFYFF